METVKRVSTFEATIASLQAEITSGRWQVGSKIPSETILTKQLGVSRASLREGVRSLVHAGMLKSKQGDGTYVVSKNATDAAIQHKLANAATNDVIEIRRGLDMVASKLAAFRRTPQDLDVIEAALAARSEAATAGDEEGFISADVAFHKAIARASHNPILIDLYESFVHALESAIRGGQCMTTSLSGKDPYHQQMFDALKAKDPVAACAATEALLNLDEIT